MIGQILMYCSILEITAIMFWQPQMSSNYEHTPYHKPTRKEKFINQVTRALQDEDYAKALNMLSQQKRYALDDLPTAYWRDMVIREHERVKTHLKNVKYLESLEERLSGK